MRGKAFRKKAIAATAALVLIAAVVLLGAMLIERLDQRRQEQELAAERETLRTSGWGTDNTLTLQGKRYGFDHRIETFLFVGTDGSGNQDSANYRGPMADYLLLMVLDHTEDTVGFLQLDRNTITEVRELDREGNEITTRQLQICTAHWYGRSPEMAAENTVYAVSQYLGSLARIDGYFVMNMSEIGRLNRAVGGVEVTIEDDMDAADPSLRRGKTLVLSDTQAANFLRVRSNVGEGTNAERMARQRQYMVSFFERVRTKTMEDPRFGLRFWDLFQDAAVTNMNGNDFSRIAQQLLKGENRGIRTVAGETVLGQVLGDGVLHEEFYPDEDSLRDEMIELFSLVALEGETREDD